MIEAQKRILVADDELPIVEGLKAMLEDDGYVVDTALDGGAAFAKLTDDDYALLIVDLTIPGRDGIQLLEAVKENGLDTEVIIITGKGTVSTAVEAMRTGAYDYLLKPVAPERLKSVIPKAIEHYTLKVSHRNLSEQLRQLTKYEDLIGKSDGMQAVYG
ncbi:MAG: response regulator, partial [candidate division KSB1 bacterium]|nr:response regulator [candidate division KSB1 bacterium]